MTTGIQKNTVVKSNRFSTNGILEDMETKYFEGAKWAKIFEHNSNSGTVVFSSVDEALNTQVENKYSRLYLLDYFKNINDKYEFLLEYPDNVPNQYNRWIQNNNPCNEYVPTTSAGDGTAEGYEAIHIDWNGHYWGGLTLQNSLTSASPINPCYLSGSVGHTNWFFAIAPRNNYQNGMPGPTGVISGKVQLWVRIDNLSEENKFQITKNCIVANDFYEI